MISENIYEQYLAFLEKALSPVRLKHSVGVMHVMEELSSIYPLDSEQARTAGLLHDAAKDLSLEEQLALAEEAGLEFRDPSERHPIYLHAPVGAYLVARDLNVTDSMVLDAIAAHSFSDQVNHANAPLSLCLRFADLLSPTSEWNGMKKFKRVIYAGQWEEAHLLQCGWLMEFFQEKQIPVHPNVLRQYEELSKKLGVSAEFFERW